MSLDAHLVVTGLMGVGKTTTAEALAATLGCDAYDSDDDIQRLFGRTGADLAASVGVPELHRMEAAVLLGRLASETPSVIAAAASVVEDERCREVLHRRARVIVLHASLDQIARRVKTGRHRRPMAGAEMAELAARRAPLFADVATLELDAALPTDELVAAALAALAATDRPPNPETPPI